MRRAKNKPARRSSRAQLHSRSTEAQKQPLLAHLRELRKRLFYSVVSVGLFAGLAYSIEDQLTHWLLTPAAGQKFIYTTPGGGFDFLFKLCLFSGIAASIPVIIYHIFRYIHPLLRHESRRFMAICTFWSSVLALAGVGFAYFFGLPAAMHFLLQGFSSNQIQALITIQSYMSFVIAYLLGAAVLFQIPLILLLINRIKPLQPRKLMKHQRWFITAAFVLGAIISPTPDIRNQLVLSGPIILMYEVSIVIIWVLNRRLRRPRKVVELLKKDAELQAQRLASAAMARLAIPAAQPATSAVAAASEAQPTFTAALQPEAPPAPPLTHLPEARRSLPPPRRRYVEDFRRPTYTFSRSVVQ